MVLIFKRYQIYKEKKQILTLLWNGCAAQINNKNYLRIKILRFPHFCLYFWFTVFSDAGFAYISGFPSSRTLITAITLLNVSTAT